MRNLQPTCGESKQDMRRIAPIIPRVRLDGVVE